MVIRINNAFFFIKNTPSDHCVKSVRVRNFSGPYFLGLRIQSQCGKILIRKTANTDTFHAVDITKTYNSILPTSPTLTYTDYFFLQKAIDLYHDPDKVKQLSGLDRYNRIRRLLVETSLDAPPGLRIQPRFEAPGDLQVKK